MYHAATDPNILRENNSGYERLSPRDLMFGRRQVELSGQVDDELTSSICRQLLCLQGEDPDAEATIFINSLGGSVSSGLAILDVMAAVSYPIRMVCLGMAASMGAVIFAAGDQRDMLPHSRLMIHDPLIQSTGGSAMQIKAIADDLMRTRSVIAETLAAHTGKTVDEILAVTSSDAYFDAEEAVKFGLADQVISKL